MKIHVIRGRDGQVVGTADAAEVSSPEGLVEIEPAIEPGQNVETVEVRRSETFDLESLYKRLAQKKK